MQEIGRIHIGASPEAVYELLADTDRRGEWQEGVETFDYASDFDANDAVGAAFTQRIREAWRVTEYNGAITITDAPPSVAQLPLALMRRPLARHTD